MPSLIRKSGVAVFPEHGRFRVRPYIDVSRHPVQRVGVVSGNALSFQYRAGIAFRLQELAYLYGFPVQPPVQLFYPQQLLYPFQLDGSGGQVFCGKFQNPVHHDAGYCLLPGQGQQFLPSTFRQWSFQVQRFSCSDAQLYQFEKER